MYCMEAYMNNRCELRTRGMTTILGHPHKMKVVNDGLCAMFRFLICQRRETETLHNCRLVLVLRMPVLPGRKMCGVRSARLRKTGFTVHSDSRQFGSHK